jgi:hypothetical protein
MARGSIRSRRVEGRATIVGASGTPGVNDRSAPHGDGGNERAFESATVRKLARRATESSPKRTTIGTR